MNVNFDKKDRITAIMAFLFLLSAMCWAGGSKDTVEQISAKGAVGQKEATLSGPMYNGDGGKDIRIAIIAPEAKGNVPEYLPLYIQGLLNNNFKKYSNITLIDRQNLEKIISEQDIGANGRFSDNDFIRIGNLTNTQYFLFGTIQKLSGERYSLKLSITDSSTGIVKADFMKDGTLSQIEISGTLINEATADLLEQMGVHLTEVGRQTLLTGNRSAVRAEAGLARGIIAQSTGADVEALFNFSQSITFNPSQIEALSRFNTLFSNIRSGETVSQRIVNDIQAREQWLDVLKEATRFFNEHPPFEIIFDPNLVQEGTTDYVKRTVNLAMRIALNPSDTSFEALNSLLEGLEKTGRRKEWGFSGWPFLDITPKTKDTIVFGGKRSFSFKVDTTLLNENGKQIGKNSITLETGNINFSAGDIKIYSPYGDFGMIRFPNIKADDLTPTLTIVITAVNGISSSELNASGYMRVDAGNLEGKAGILATLSRNEKQLLKEPLNNALILETGINYIQYAEYYIKFPVMMLPSQQNQMRESELRRAKDFYLKGVKVLENAKNVDNDISFLYWKFYGVYSAFTLDVFDFSLTQKMKDYFNVLNRAYTANQSWENGKLDEILFLAKASLPSSMGGDKVAAIQHFNNAIIKSSRQRVKPFVLYAQAVSVPEQNNNSFRERLNEALAINPSLKSEYELENKFYQDFARYLLNNEANFFSSNSR